MKSKTINVWVCVNKNGFINTFNSQPTRNATSGKWESKYPFVNSVFYNEVKQIVKQAKMTWESEPEFFEITLQ